MAAGWNFDPINSFFNQGRIRIFVSGGCPSIQRRLELEKPYFQYAVKTVSTVAQTIDDSLAVDVSETITRVLTAAADHAKAA